MEFRKLGSTDIDVTNICLGTMTFGEQNTEDEGHAQMDYALDRGINFFDTAEIYAVPPRPETQGSTERIIGTWFNARGNRDKIVLATKAAGRSPMKWMRDGGVDTQQTKEQLEFAVNRSLKNLQTDYVDLYQLHWPDRPIQLFGGLGYRHMGDEINKVADILGALQDLVTAGKIRHIGLSNETAWGTMKFLHHSDMDCLPRVQSVQNAYNLLNRTDEQGLAEVYHREGVSLLGYSPLAQGYLTGKYQKGALPDKSRKALFNRLQRYEGAPVESLIDQYAALAKYVGVSLTALSQKFVDTRPFVGSNIIGATTMEQLIEDIDGHEIEWTEEIEQAVTEIHLSCPNPCP
jgi:aryl-alcohol dehydrogenase-like predicted oxidoreductase